MKIRKSLLLGAICVSLFCGCTSLHDEPEAPKTGITNEAEKDYGNTSGNITNYGSAAEYKGYIYCQYGEKGENFARISPDGEVGILKETMPYFINIVNDVIYYADANDSFKLHRMTTDGEGDEVVINSSVYYVNVYRGYIYFASPTDNYAIYRSNADGSDTKKLHDGNCQYLTVYEDTIYFSNFENGGALYACSLDGSNERMLNKINTMYINAYKNYLYYSGKVPGDEDYTEKAIYRQPIVGGDSEKLNDVESGDINVAADKIYYTDWTTNKIMRMNLDGSENEVYDEVYGNYLNIAGNKLFCIRYTGSSKEISLNMEDIK